MSRHGVTYWSENESHFTELDAWMAEYDKYSKLTKIRAFKRYRIWKCFKVWRKSIQWKKYSEARKFIKENLFFAMPALAKALLQIRDETEKLNQLDFVDISVIEDWQLLYFMERQMEACDSLRTKLVEYHQTVRELLRKFV